MLPTVPGHLQPASLRLGLKREHNTAQHLTAFILSLSIREHNVQTTLAYKKKMYPFILLIYAYK